MPNVALAEAGALLKNKDEASVASHSCTVCSMYSNRKVTKNTKKHNVH